MNTYFYLHWWPLHYCELFFFRGRLLSFFSHSLLMYERALYHDMHVCNCEKGFDVFLQGAGKAPLLNAAS